MSPAEGGPFHLPLSIFFFFGERNLSCAEVFFANRFPLPLSKQSHCTEQYIRENTVLPEGRRKGQLCVAIILSLRPIVSAY